MEQLITQLKSAYYYDDWKRHFDNDKKLYLPAMLKFQQNNKLKLMRSCAPVNIVGAYEVEWVDTTNKNRHFRLTVVPYATVEEADDQVISRLLYVSVLLPRIDAGSDSELVAFGLPESIIVGRIRNVYWCIQNLGTEGISLDEIQQELIKSIKSGKQRTLS